MIGFTALGDAKTSEMKLEVKGTWELKDESISIPKIMINHKNKKEEL